jgi:hypothetical protein
MDGLSHSFRLTLRGGLIIHCILEAKSERAARILLTFAGGIETAGGVWCPYDDIIGITAIG